MWFYSKKKELFFDIKMKNKRPHPGKDWISFQVNIAKYSKGNQFKSISFWWLAIQHKELHNVHETPKSHSTVKSNNDK